jgi:hypothetical protein
MPGFTGDLDVDLERGLAPEHTMTASLAADMADDEP